MVLAIIQARMSSSRLPGKVLAEVAGAPMILRQLERVHRARSIDSVVVATSTDASDDVLTDVLTENGVEVHRGSLTDVLARFLDVVRRTSADRILRLTADCPLADPDVIDDVVAAHDAATSDYASNVLERSYPRGLDVELVTADALERIAAVASAEEREHVTLGIYRRPDEFRLTSVSQKDDRSDLRWTVDLPADLEFIRAVYGDLYATKPAFTSDDVYELISRRPELRHLEV